MEKGQIVNYKRKKYTVEWFTKKEIALVPLLHTHQGQCIIPMGTFLKYSGKKEKKKLTKYAKHGTTRDTCVIVDVERLRKRHSRR